MIKPSPCLKVHNSLIGDWQDGFGKWLLRNKIRICGLGTRVANWHVWGLELRLQSLATKILALTVELIISLLKERGKKRKSFCVVWHGIVIFKNEESWIWHRRVKYSSMIKKNKRTRFKSLFQYFLWPWPSNLISVPPFWHQKNGIMMISKWNHLLVVLGTW